MDPKIDDPNNPNQPDLSSTISSTPPPTASTATNIPEAFNPSTSQTTPLPDLSSTPPPPIDETSTPPIQPESTPTFPPSSTPLDTSPPVEQPITPTFTPEEPQGVSGSFTWPTSNPAPPLENTYSEQSSLSSTSAPNIPNPITPTQIPTTEPAPSDLSHLVNPDILGVNPTEPPITPSSTVSQPETLVSNAAGSTAEVPNIPTEVAPGGGIPKWVIGVGVGLLLAVVAASAYFILGIGKTPPPKSTPAEGSEQGQQTSVPLIQPSPIPTIAIPTATPSAGFGTLPGGSGTQATSAADLLKQRQGR